MTKDILENLKKQISTEELGETVLLKISKDIEEQMQSFNLEPQWKDYFKAEFDEDEDLHVAIGPRDVQYNKQGDKVGSGYFLLGVDKPWEK